MSDRLAALAAEVDEVMDGAELKALRDQGEQVLAGLDLLLERAEEVKALRAAKGKRLGRDAVLQLAQIEFGLVRLADALGGGTDG